jgi:signal transduction histidine kinase
METANPTQRRIEIGSSIAADTLRILIIAENAEESAFYRRLLATDPRHRYEFLFAATGEQALRLYRDRRPDCVLLDSLLPDMDGPELLTRIGEAPDAGTVAAVMITGHADEPAAAHTLQNGALDHILKDAVTADALQRAVHHTVERARLLHTITHQRRELEAANQELVEANQRLREHSQLKSDFLANASHELRTPLNSILGFLRLILDGMCESPDEERLFIQTAFESAESLLALINDLLDVSKIEAGKMTLDLEAVNLEKLFNELYLLAHLQAREKNLKLELSCAADGPITVRADYGKLRQILLNLISNAIKFTDAGSVTVRAIPALERGFVTVNVQDTGIGIQPEMQGKLFGKFIQADSSTTRKHGGTGLGLTIAKSLAELMGGVIKLESDGLGKGTRVSFTVPVYREADVESTDWPQVASQGAQVSGDPAAPLVLIAEDDVHFRTMLEEMAHQAGFSTVYALTADDTVILARKLKPVAITLDHGLLVSRHATLRDGWDAYAALVTDESTEDIPVIFISGHEGYLQEKMAEKPLAKHPRFVVKPFTADDFTEALREAAESGRALQRGEASA